MPMNPRSLLLCLSALVSLLLPAVAENLLGRSVGKICVG